MSLYTNDYKFNLSGWGNMGGVGAGALNAPTGILDTVNLRPTALYLSLS